MRPVTWERNERAPPPVAGAAPVAVDGLVQDGVDGVGVEGMDILSVEECGVNRLWALGVSCTGTLCKRGVNVV